MTFYSVQFGVFFALVTALYYLAPQRLRVPVLLTASALFYLTFIPRYIFILLALITVDYFAGLLIERSATSRARTAWLLISLATNLAFMVAFKYVPDVTGKSLGVIPIGLSFHTFQAMAYTLEVYRGRHPAERSFTVYALYVMFFPQIAAGPIERPQNLMPQFRKPQPFRYENVVQGLQLMAWGMFQKYVVADRLSDLVNNVYAPRSPLSGPIVALAAVCFAFQIFCDFCGYTDIALGAAQVLGFRLSRNFNAPFHSDSMAEYWKRWHISLSAWMRDYVFFPLCGNRPRMRRICGSILIVFLANGLWHGARWNYLISGFLHGTYRVTELLAGRALSRAGWTLPAPLATPLRVARTLLVFSLMSFAFLFFRGANLTQTLDVIGRLFSDWSRPVHSGLSRNYFISIAALIAIVEAVQFLRARGPLRPRIAALPSWGRWSVYYGATAAVLFFGREGAQAFIYFQF